MDSNEDRIIDAIAILSAEFPNITLTQANYKAYLLVLGDLPAELVELACQELATSGREFFPPAGVIRQTAFNIEEAVDEIPSALEAWGAVKGQPYEGSYEGDLIDRAMKTLGGWRAWGNSNIDDEPSWRARFIQAYEILAQRERDERRRLPKVAGYIEQKKAEKVDNEIKRLLGEKRID